MNLLQWDNKRVAQLLKGSDADFQKFEAKELGELHDALASSKPHATLKVINAVYALGWAQCERVFVRDIYRILADDKAARKQFIAAATTRDQARKSWLLGFLAANAKVHMLDEDGRRKAQVKKIKPK